MKLQVYRSLWGYPGPSATVITEARTCGFDGVEGPAPATAEARCEWRAMLDGSGLDFIAEICTMEAYVPRPGASPDEHFDSLLRQAHAALDCRPRFFTVLGGSDAWTVAQSVDFLGRAIVLSKELELPISFETHRSRCTYSPWITRELLRQLPELRLTCDFSHWCCVCERLVLDEEPELLALCAAHAHHVHARVGYDQGPQVPHPAAPEYAGAVAAHERWWRAIWNEQERAGATVSTMTPEFGPDGYLHIVPFSRTPVADLEEINLWMAERQRLRFAERFFARAA